MADFDAAAWQEAERRYPDKGGCYEEHARHAYARAAFEAGARWGAEQADAEVRRLTAALAGSERVRLAYKDAAAHYADAVDEKDEAVTRAERAEAALAYFVMDGVCLTCGDGVLASGEHIDPERHAAYRYTAEDIDYARDEARAALAEVAALHGRYFDIEKGPGDYEAGPEPEDIWRFDRDLRAILARTEQRGADR